MAKVVFHPAHQRGHADHGWLNARHSFSFAGWYDPSRIHYGALRVLNDDIVKGGMGFGKHPHDNMEIITIVLSGELAHKDSMGHQQTIYPGEVQVMSAGTGVFHSEFNPDHHEEVNLLQTWIFPNKRNVQPRYDQTFFDEEGRKNKLQLLVSSMEGNEEGLKIHQDARIFRSELEAGATVSHTLKSSGHGAYVFVISGSVSIKDQKLNRRDAMGISDTDTFDIIANTDSDLVLFEVPMEIGFE